MFVSFSLLSTLPHLVSFKLAWTEAVLLYWFWEVNILSSIHNKKSTQTDSPEEKISLPYNLPWDLWLWMLTCFFKKAWLFPSLCLFLIVFYSHCSPGRKPSYCFSLQQMLSSCRNLSAAEPILLGVDFLQRVGGVCVWWGFAYSRLHSSVRLFSGRKG